MNVSGRRSRVLRGSRAVGAVAGVAVCVAAACVPVAAASDATLGRAVHQWSRTLAADARRVGVDARQRHPRRMEKDALRFAKDARRAQAAVIKQRPSSARGRQARTFALAAFAQYGRAGAQWASSARARAHGAKAAADRYAKVGTARAAAGGRQLVLAGKLLPR